MPLGAALDTQLVHSGALWTSSECMRQQWPLVHSPGTANVLSLGEAALPLGQLLALALSAISDLCCGGGMGSATRSCELQSLEGVLLPTFKDEETGSK